MNSNFTIFERLIAGVYFAIVASIGLGIFSYILPFGFFLVIASAGFVAGITIPPYLLNPNIYSVTRSLITGCLTTLTAAIISALIFTVLGNQLSFKFLYKFLLIGIVLTIPYSLFGALAMMLFSDFLAEYRANLKSKIGV